MFDDGEVNDPGVERAVRYAYQKFSTKWGLSTDVSIFVEIWSPMFNGFEPAHIDVAVDYCVREYRRPPVPAELIELTSRVRDGRALTEPIVSRKERLAWLILSSDEFSTLNVSSSEMSDACLIAGAIAHQQSYESLSGPIASTYLSEEFTSRARMFFEESLNWKLDSEQNKGFWKDKFGGGQQS